MRIPYGALVTFITCQFFEESGCLGLQPKLGGRSHLKLNIVGRPIAKKYSDGKVKRTLKRRSKVLETVKRETDRSRKYWVGDSCIQCYTWCFMLYFVCMGIKFMILGVVFCLSFCWYKVYPFGDTTELGSLATAGKFGFVGNFWYAFGRKCVLSGIWD